MEISWVSNTFEQFNGIAFYIKRICPLLAKRLKLRLYTGRVKGSYPFEVKSLPCFSNPVFPEYDFVLPFLKFQGDVLHVHTPYGLGVAAVSSPLPKVATTHTLPHHLVEFMFKKEISQGLLKIGWKYLTWFFNHFDRVVCQTHATKKMFRKYGLKAKVEIIPNGIDVEEFRCGNPDRFRKKYGINGQFAMYLGRFDYTKRPDWVIEIAKDLHQYKFLLIGSGPLYKHLPRTPNAVFLGRLTEKDKIDALSAASMLIMPSRVEIDAIVANEALACGTPTIIANDDALHEVIGDAGFKCPSLENMKEKVRALFEDDKLRLEMRAKAFEQAKKRDINKSVNLLIDLYEKLV